MLPKLAAGHVHAYERTFQTLNYQVDGCAPRWLTMGASVRPPLAPPACRHAACLLAAGLMRLKPAHAPLEQCMHAVLASTSHERVHHQQGGWYL